MESFRVILISLLILLDTVQFGQNLPIKENSFDLMSAEAQEVEAEPAIQVTHEAEVDPGLKTSSVVYTEVENSSENVQVAQALTEITNVVVSETFSTLAIRSDPVRPGMSVTSYSLEIEPNGNTFNGRLIIQVNLDQGTLDDPVKLHAEDLTVTSVTYGISSILNPQPAIFTQDDGILEITTPVPASTFFFLIIFQGLIRTDGYGLYRGSYDNDDSSYLAMNLYPTHARRVFPCVDEPSQSAALALTVFNDAYGQIVSNAQNEGDANEARFTPMQTTTHLWGMVAHDFQNLINSGERLRFYGRSGIGSTQHSYASLMSQILMILLHDYTEKPYFEIDNNSEQFLHVFALPDITRDWLSLSTVGIWEPDILMNEVHSIDQQKNAIVAMAKAYSRQWFGYVIHPENWRFSWITIGLQIHVAYELADQADEQLDMNALFVTDISQQGMYLEGHANVLALESVDDILDEDEIREYINGPMKYKAPALMKMIKYVLGDETDYIKSAATALLNTRALQSVNNNHFENYVKEAWLFFDNTRDMDFVADFLEPWLRNPGYPVINVATSTAGNTVIVTQERFAFSNVEPSTYYIPLTWATSINPNFDNLYAERVLTDTGISFGVELIEEDDWLIFNLQGVGYYRVNYDFGLWERIIWALEDPERRAVIHPLNRAQLVDDALNLARAGRLDYDIAFQVVLTMEHETDYVVWKAFIRNMDFLRKRLATLDPDDYDWDIYLRMVRRSIVAVENTLTFNPDPLLIEDSMLTMTRALVMDHACRASYQPCIAAAIDLFYASTGTDIAINPNIPHALRPAVFCTMVREGGPEVRDLLWQLYETENVHYEKVVILESLACSQDQDFLLSFLQDTIAPGIFGIEERSRIFKAIANSGYGNADVALRFLNSNIFAVRNRYGGAEKVEELLLTLSENMADHDLTNNFYQWITNINSDLAESTDMAIRLADQVMENLIWNDVYMENVYQWIDENNASGLTVSLALLIVGLCVAFFNH